LADHTVRMLDVHECHVRGHEIQRPGPQKLEPGRVRDVVLDPERLLGFSSASPLDDRGRGVDGDDLRTGLREPPRKVSIPASQVENIKSTDVLVDCWAEWCAPCRAIAPMIDGLAKTYAGKVTFVKLNTDENPRVPQQFMVMGIPTLLFFKDGKLVDQVVGAMPKGPFEARLKKHLA